LPQSFIRQYPYDRGCHLTSSTVNQHARPAALKGVPDATIVDRDYRRTHSERFKHPYAEPFVAVSANRNIDISIEREHFFFRQSPCPDHGIGKTESGGPVLEFSDLAYADCRSDQDIFNIGKRFPDLRKRILFTLRLLFVYRLSGHLPTPGVK